MRHRILTILTTRRLAVFVVLSCLFGHSRAASLDGARRIEAHRAVERVLWERRIWPEANGGPKPPLEEVLPDAALRARIDDVLRKSNALAELWHRPIGAAELGAEIDRMTRSSQAPGTLDAMFAAVGRDPLLVAEAIARPALVDRLIRSWYAGDARYHDDERREAERALAGAATAEDLGRIAPRYATTTWTIDAANHAQSLGGAAAATATAASAASAKAAAGATPRTLPLDPTEWRELLVELSRRVSGRAAVEPSTEDLLGDLPVGRIGPLQETDEAFTATVVLSKTAGSVKLGVASWPKTSFDAWWSVERTRHSAIVPDPGDEIETIPLGHQPVSDLSRTAYFASSASWTLTSSCTDDTWRKLGTGAPIARVFHAAVWTGSEMIVWGGQDLGSVKLDSGGRYDPATDTWSTLSTIAAPSPRIWPAAVWTGTKMIIWGGTDAGGASSAGGLYDPATDTWVQTSQTGAPSYDPEGRGVWTGSLLLVWPFSSDFSFPINGHRYNPVSNSWSPMNPVGAPIRSTQSEAVWTGSRMVLWPGKRYDPLADSWAPISSTGAPAARGGHALVWTGSKVFVWGGYSQSGDLGDGALYDPSTDTWSPVSTTGAPQARSRHSGIWIPSAGRVVVWGGTNNSNPLQTGGRYDPATNTWASTTLAGAPTARVFHAALTTGSRMIVWGGVAPALIFNTGGVYDPMSDSWVPTRAGVPSPTARSQHAAVWTGGEMIVWGGSWDDGLRGDGAAYNPATDAWRPISASSAPSPRALHTAVWTGTSLLAWGGQDGGYAGTGGRYNPVADSWTPITTTGAPAGRSEHTAVWSGSRMIVWGGTNGSGPLDTGGRYDPAADAWLPVSTSGAPSARSIHSAVWTGSSMIVWGGSGPPGYLETGGRYDPNANTWSATSTSAAPVGRMGHAAVWTGSHMLIWGGWIGSPLATGSSYDPAVDAWEAISMAGVPQARTAMSAIWNGAEMIVWGGFGSATYMNSGGRYRPDDNSWRPTTGAGALRARGYHGGTWTGGGMVIWGGQTEAGNYNDGASYCACVSWYPDSDGDGYGALAAATSTCDGSHPAGTIGRTGDCNDANPAVHPGVADATCNGVDEDCDAQFDEDFVPQPSVCGMGVCLRSGSLSCSGGQVVDSCVAGPPNAPTDDTCNTVDDDCDGSVDEDFPAYPDHWIAIASAPSARTNYTAVSSGAEIIVFGGDNGSGVVQTGGIAYDLVANTWRTLPTGPAKRWHHTAVWADTRMIVWGGDDGSTTIYNNGSRYDPFSNTWAATATTGAPSARGGHSAVWTGSRMVIWGGRDAATHFNTGSRYDPAANSWTATATTGAPAARWLHTAVWTGTEMIVWGGQSSTGTALNTGARYNPGSNTWTAVSTTGAPSGRYGHVAVWTGSEMIVWGGASDATTYFASGARYNPSTNTWTPMSTSGAPSPRGWVSAVWTGELLIWGGTYRTNEDPDTALSNGARYLLPNNVWVPMNPHFAPAARARTTAVLQGGEMFVWGGNPNGAARTDGARYVPYTACGVGTCQRLGTMACSGTNIVFQCTPGSPQPEVCDGYDNNCNAVVDDGIPVPAERPVLSATKLAGGTARIIWSATSNTTGYDVVRGNAGTLRSTGGNFTSSVEMCLQNNTAATQADDALLPSAGAGVWYLVRPVNTCSGNGSYDETAPSQQGLRDAEIASSAGACP